MDSLLANYASSDEDDRHQQSPPPAKSVELQPAKSEEQKDDSFMPKRGGGLFSSLPPPKSSLFSSLPQPRSHSLRNPNPNPNTQSQFDEKLPENSNPKPSSSSLFSSLPLPKSTVKAASPASSLSSVLPLPKSGSKTVVQFRPPTVLNPRVDDDDDDDDDDEDERERQRKRSKEELPASSSLSSILPAPRSSATLGAALGAGRRSMLETGTPASSGTAVSDALAGSNVGYVENQSSEISYDYSSYYSGDAVVDPNLGHSGFLSNEIYDHNQSGGVGGENYAYYSGYGEANATCIGAGGDAGVSSDAGSFGAVDYSHGDGQHVDYANYGGVYGDYGNNVQYNNTWANEAALPEGSGMAGSALPLPGRKGKKDAPPQIIEVKQDELMKNRPREDQVKLTGIAFGPAYQPAPSKGKPTKLHKRKHQIGALYFDMRQREMELAERRAKGFLTKAQTQAKYGWS